VISKKGEVRKARESFQADNRSLDHQVIYNLIEREFQETFIEELIPGIVHNFANPLNGIMGRARLLQRRLMEITQSGVRDDSSYEDNKNKLIHDVDSIVRESDRLSSILQSVAGKFCAVSDKTIQRINLSELIELEMKFLDFYLEFKHSIKKVVQLEQELPEVKGTPADYSLALSALIRHSMSAMKESDSTEFYISTQFENGHVCMKIRNQGPPIREDQKRLLLEESQTDISSLGMERNEGLTCAFLLLKKWGARFEIQSESGFNVISVLIPPGRQRVSSIAPPLPERSL
jgi:signal transduction histidine kinase